MFVLSVPLLAFTWSTGFSPGGFPGQHTCGCCSIDGCGIRVLCQDECSRQKLGSLASELTLGNTCDFYTNAYREDWIV